MKLGILNAKNPEHDETGWAELDLLNEAGIRAMRAAKRFIYPLDGEKPQRYEDRCRTIALIGYVGPIIDYFVSALFMSGLDVTEAVDADDDTTPGEAAQQDEFWQEFAKDADRKGTPFSGVMREAARQALLKKRAILACDFPNPSKKPESRLEEKQLGADRGYCYNLELAEMIDWELDDEGKYEWCILYEKIVQRPNPKATRSFETHAWTIWTLGDHDDVSDADLEALEQAKSTGDEEKAQSVMRKLMAKSEQKKGQDSVAQWERYEKIVPLDFKDWTDDMDIPLVDNGKTSFTEIPFIVMELPPGLWAGNKLLPLQIEHWTRRSQLAGAQGRNLTATKFVSLSTNDSGLGADALDEGTKRALRDEEIKAIVPGTIGVAEPNAQAYEAIQKDLDGLKDEMHRISHQMAMSVDNSSSTMRRSGESKKQDKADIEVVLEALAVFVKTTAIRIYRLLASAMKEADVIWTARGLDEFVTEDRNDLVTEGTGLSLILPTVPSPTWKKETLTQFAFRWTPNLDPTTQDTIRKEIQDGVDANQELDDALLDQQKDEVNDTPTPGEIHDDNTKVAMTAAKTGAPVQKNGAPPSNGAPPKKPKPGKPASKGA